MDHREFQNLALERLEDARALLAAKRYAGAYYLAGYAIECALKACISGLTMQDDFPPKDAARYYVHDLAKLLESAGLGARLREEAASNERFEANWATAKDWTEEARYGARDQQQAEALLAAVGDPQHGVLQWLRKYW
ncbi:MAG TPA: HEPN domain-containing protein [Bryobacterales bacterium]|nr:HEPN domain-containing protein [Bryobacterales bacterium]